MTDQQVAEARERFREEVKVLRLSQFPDVAAATIAWERGFADAVRLATEDMKEMRVNLERRQAYDWRRS